MILIYAILFILFEAIAEALIKKHCPQLSEVIFQDWLQWVIAGLLFLIWFVLMLGFEGYYVPVWKLITGFVGVRILIFSPVYNLFSGLPIGYYDTTKLYDRIMTELGGFGLLMQIVCGIVGICFLMGWE